MKGQNIVSAMRMINAVTYSSHLYTTDHQNVAQHSRSMEAYEEE